MESNLRSPPPDNADSKASFRKPVNDAASRKYRRRSPVSGSSSSDVSPKREHSSSPIFSREDPAKVSDHRRRKDDGRELDRDSGRSQYGRSGESYRHSDRQSSRSSHGYHRNDDYIKHEKHADEEERNYSKLSSRAGRESRGGTHSDHTRRESEHNRSRDNLRNVDKYFRDKPDGAGHRSRDKERESSPLDYQKYKDKDSSSDRAGTGGRRHTNLNVEEIKSGERDRHIRDRDGRDEKRDYRRSLGDYKSERTPSYEESRGHRNDSTSGRDNGEHRLKEAHKSDPKELDGQKHSKEEKKKYDDRENNRHKDRYKREPEEQFEQKNVFASKNQESAAKKPKLFSLDKGTDHGKDVSKSTTTVADERQSSSSKQAQELVGKVTPEQAHANDSEIANDINAAKVAAMKAAELVNRNLVGTGYMSADQKKKLLWGNKKSTTPEESGHRWDTALFSDRERQEKFNKLMGVKGDLNVEHKPDSQDGGGLLQAEKQKELQMDLEKQYTAGLRRRDGRTVGLGL